MGKYAIGEFEEVIMLTVAILYGKAYGISIKEEIEDRLGRKVSLGAMRTTLNRLENKGFIESEFGEATSVRGGKRKRFYKVTMYGKKALDQVRNSRAELWSSIPEKAFEYNLKTI